MSEKNRVLYFLLREEGLSVKEAGAVLGTTADVIKQRAHCAYEQLRGAIDPGARNSYNGSKAPSSPPPYRRISSLSCSRLVSIQYGSARALSLLSSARASTQRCGRSFAGGLPQTSSGSGKLPFRCQPAALGIRDCAF